MNLIADRQLQVRKKRTDPVYLAGATGLVGRAVLERALHHPSVSKVIALVRDASGFATSPLLGSRLDLLPLATSETAQSIPFEAGAVLVCAIGTTIKKAGSKEAFRRVDFELPLALAKRAQSCGIRTLVLISASGASSASPIFYSRVKGELEDAIQHLGIPRVAILQPSLLIGDRAENRLGERFGIQSWRVLSPILPGSISRRLGTKVDTLADRVLAEALSSDPGFFRVPAQDI